ncbi:phage major capsid protein [Brucella pituitosa]|uniref:phage major capsid protein n=1 Tax=Brucella pituitosa TaxID=571256 RepID=UPI003C729853
MTTINTVTALIEKQGEAFEAFKASHDSRLKSTEAAVDDANSKLAAIMISGAGQPHNASPNSARNGGRARAALGTFVKTGNEEAFNGLGPKAAMQVGVPEDGGYIVPDELSTTIIEAQRDVSPMRRLAKTVMTKASNYQQPFNLGGTASGWVGETDDRDETDTSKLTLLEFPAGEVYANPAVTQRMLDDSPINIGDFVISEITKEFEEQEGTAFLNGNGVNKPKGLLTYPQAATADSTRPFGTLQTVASSAAPKFDEFIDLLYSLKAGYRRRASWLLNSRTMGAIAKIKDGDGRYLLQQSVALGIPSTILGYPVEVDEGMPDIAPGSTPVAWGDFESGYLINDRMGIKILRDPYSRKPFVQFYTTKRVGGGLLDSNAIKLMKIGS